MRPRRSSGSCGRVANNAPLKIFEQVSHPDATHADSGSVLQYVDQQRLAIAVRVGNPGKVNTNAPGPDGVECASPTALSFGCTGTTETSLEDESDFLVVTIDGDLQHSGSAERCTGIAIPSSSSADGFFRRINELA